METRPKPDAAQAFDTKPLAHLAHDLRRLLPRDLEPTESNVGHATARLHALARIAYHNPADGGIDPDNAIDVLDPLLDAIRFLAGFAEAQANSLWETSLSSRPRRALECGDE